MIIIAHRGNTNGKSKFENHPDYINNALSMKLHAEIDVWYADKKFYLGHDAPQYSVKKEFLLQDHLWCHAKSVEALEQLLKLNVTCFFHNNDDATLTSNGYIWTFPGKPLTKKSICVYPENYPEIKLVCSGICSDYPITYTK